MFRIFSRCQNFNLFRNFWNRTTLTSTPDLRFKDVLSQSNTYKILQKTPFKYENGSGYIRTSTNSTKSPNALRINTEITDKKHSILGFYEYTINKSTETTNHGYIETAKTKRRNGLGEILRLSSLIEFKENGIKTLELEAFPAAIPFHLKCKLKPNLTTSDKTLKILNDIKNNPNVSPYYSKTAELLAQAIELKNTISLDKETRKIVNKFIESFTKQHIHNWKNAKFKQLLPMILTECRLKQFADFYNKLFKKHGINYKI